MFSIINLRVNEVTEKNEIYLLTELHEAVEYLSNYFKRSIIIENKDFELVVYNTPNEFLFDPIQQKTILTKRCPLFVIERLKTDGIIEKLVQSDKPLRIEAMLDINFYQRIVISLRHEEKMLGYLWIYETDELLDDTKLKEIESIVPYISKLYYEEQSKEKNYVSEVQTMLWKLINNEYLNEAHLKKEALLVNFKLPEVFTVVVASVVDPEQLSVLEKIKEIFIKTSIAKVAFYLGKGTEVIGIIYGDHTAQNDLFQKTSLVMAEIKATLTKKEKDVLYIGIGTEYDQINAVRTSYLEALEVVEILVFLDDSSMCELNYDSLGVKRYLKDVYKKNIEEDYYNKIALTLIRKDKENNSELLKTLYVYLQNDCKVGTTAEILFIHPNTLSYRIKQMQKEVNFDLECPNEKAILYLELTLIFSLPEYLKRYKRKVKTYSK